MRHLRNNIDFEKVATVLSMLYRTTGEAAPLATDAVRNIIISKSRSKIDDKINTEDDYEQSIAKKKY